MSTGYAIVWEHSDNHILLVGVDIIESVLDQIPDLFDLSIAFLRANCTVFEFNTGSISQENPVLPATIGPGDTLFQYPGGLWSPSKIYYLYYWDFHFLEFPAGALAVDGMCGWAQWEYRADPPAAQYLAPYEHYTVPHPEGEVLVSRYSPIGNYDMELLLKTNDDIGNQSHIIRDKALWIHEEGGDPDWSDYALQRPPDPTHFYLQADTVLPDQPSYQGQYPWDIPSLVPHLQSAQYYNPDRYFVWMVGCEIDRWKPCFRHPSAGRLAGPVSVLGTLLACSGLLGKIFGPVGFPLFPLVAGLAGSLTIDGEPLTIDGEPLTWS